MPENLRRPAVLIAALALGAACKRAPVEPPPAAVGELAPPAPSASLVASPLDNAATGYTNEMQAANLRKESAALGIQHISRAASEGQNRDDVPRGEAPPPLSAAEKKERMRQLREMTNQFTRMRRSIDAARDKSVSLPGSTAAVIKGRESGGTMGASEEAAGRWSGLYGGAVEAGERVIETGAAWKELWSRVSPDEAPAVDFAASRVAAVFLGSRPSGGFRARLVDIVEQKERVVVRWTEDVPAPGTAPPEGETAPFLLVSVPKDDRPLRLEKSDGPKGLK